jgi:hypothetical protein
MNTKYIYGITVAKKSEYDVKHSRAIAFCPPPHMFILYYMKFLYHFDII